MRAVRAFSRRSAVGVLFLAGWEAVVRLRGIPLYILPAPSAIALSLWTDGPSLFASLLVTLRITLAALAAAALFGGALALLFSRSRLLELSLFPYAVILQVTPIVAIAPLIIIWVRQPFLALLVCAWIVAFFPIVSNTTVGLNSADRNLLACSGCTAPRRGRRCWLLRMPTALPYFLAGAQDQRRPGADRRGRRRVRRRHRRRRNRASPSASSKPATGSRSRACSRRCSFCR